jgi:hypothetical protein
MQIDTEHLRGFLVHREHRREIEHLAHQAKIAGDQRGKIGNALFQILDKGPDTGEIDLPEPDRRAVKDAVETMLMARQVEDQRMEPLEAARPHQGM